MTSCVSFLHVRNGAESICLGAAPHAQGFLMDPQWRGGGVVKERGWDVAAGHT